MEQIIRLDKDSKVPIHQQLYSYIKERIAEGFYKENEIIPSEKEMQEMFEVSRITVRRAISDLEHDGYLIKRKGRGTIVCPQKKERDMSVFNSFSGDAKVKGALSFCTARKWRRALRLQRCFRWKLGKRFTL